MSARPRRRPQPHIVDLAADPREWFSLRVVAAYLMLDERTVRARIEDGRLQADIDGRVYRISKTSLRAYTPAPRSSA